MDYSENVEINTSKPLPLKVLADGRPGWMYGYHHKANKPQGDRGNL